MEVGGQRHAPVALPQGKSWYPLCRRLGGSQGLSGRVRKISPPPGFDLRTVQPVASRCTDHAIPAHISATVLHGIHNVKTHGIPRLKKQVVVS